MKLKTFLITAIATAAFAFSSCSGETKDFSGQWNIYGFKVNGVEQQLAVSDINFEKQSDTLYSVNGSSGVNSYFGDVSIKGTKIKPGKNFGSTKMMGDPDLMNFERDFLDCLTGATSAKITEKNGSQILEIFNSKSNSVLTFIRK